MADLARALAERELGALYRTHAKFLEGEEQTGKYRQARAAFERALETSHEVKDLHTQAQALLDLLVIGYLERREVDAVYAEQLRELLARYDYAIIGALLAFVIWGWKNPERFYVLSWKINSGK